MNEKSVCKCVVCGTEFVRKNQRHIYCNMTCKKQVERSMRKKYVKPNEENKTKKHTANNELVNIAIAARKAGMTYGQYVQKMGL